MSEVKSCDFCLQEFGSHRTKIELDFVVRSLKAKNADLESAIELQGKTLNSINEFNNEVLIENKKLKADLALAVDILSKIKKSFEVDYYDVKAVLADMENEHKLADDFLKSLDRKAVAVVSVVCSNQESAWLAVTPRNAQRWHRYKGTLIVWGQVKPITCESKLIKKGD